MDTRPNLAPQLSASLNLLKWFAAIVPAVAIFSAETVRHDWIEPNMPVGDAGNVAVGFIAFGCTLLFSHVVFRIIGGMQAELVRRNAELEAVNQIAASANVSTSTSTSASASTGTSADASSDPIAVVAAAQPIVAALFPQDVVHVLAGDERPEDALALRAPGCAAAGPQHDQIVMPLESHCALLGSMVVTRRAGTFTADERRLLHLLGDTLRMAVQNRVLLRELRSAAISEERTRLAREMHDGIAQLLASMLVQIDVAEGRLREGDVTRLTHDLQRVRTTAEQANAEVRAEIAGLRLLTERDVDLIARMRAYVEDFEDQTDIVATFSVQGNATHAPLADPGLQLVRILQEALANVRKHSQATAVDVRLRLERSGAELVIEDNGCGLPLASEREASSGLARHFGLATMRERAESQGGHLELLPASTYRSGTRVQVAMPTHTHAHMHTEMPTPLNGGAAHGYGAATAAAG